MLKRSFIITITTILILAVLIPMTNGQAQFSVGPLASSSARFRVVVAANLTTNVDIWLDGVITAESGLKSVKPLNDSGFITITAGAHTITLNQTGTTTAASTPFVFTFSAGTNLSIILLPDNTWMTIANTGTAPLPLQATARLINLSPNNNPVSLSVDLTAPPAFTSIAFKSTSASYLAIPIGIHALAIPGSTAKVVNHNFLDGHVYSIYVFWEPSATIPKILVSAETSFIKNTPTPTGLASTPTTVAATPTMVAATPTMVAATPTTVAATPTAVAATPTLVAATPTKVPVTSPTPGPKPTRGPGGSFNIFIPVVEH